MKNFDKEEAYKKSWEILNDHIELRAKQIRDAVGHPWWGDFIGDEHYCFLLGELTKLKMNRTELEVMVKMSEEDIRRLESGKPVMFDTSSLVESK